MATGRKSDRSLSHSRRSPSTPAIIVMAHALGLIVVAEGQIAYLRDRSSRDVSPGRG
jgi:sensor c-di-GMP phosphodiesterase-like protein